MPEYLQVGESYHKYPFMQMRFRQSDNIGDTRISIISVGKNKKVAPKYSQGSNLFVRADEGNTVIFLA